MERMVQTVKGILKNSTDPHLAVLSYRATPMPWCGLSPSELLMGRRIRTTVPQAKRQLIPSWSYLPQFKQDNLQFKEKQKENFDKHHRVKEQFEILDGSEVVITTDKQPVEGRVVEPAEAPRSYIMETPSGEVRRNRSQLNVVPEHSSTVELEMGSSPTSAREQPRRIVTRSQTGTAIRPPETVLKGGDVVRLRLCMVVCCKIIHCALLRHWNVLYKCMFMHFSESVNSVSLSVKLILRIYQPATN